MDGMKASDADLLKMREANVPYREIMRRFGYTTSEQIRIRERRLGLPPRKPGGGPRKPNADGVWKKIHSSN